MKGKLYAIGLGPGGEDNMTIRARRCIEGCDVLVGYSVYIDQIEPFCSGKTLIRNGMGQEKDRCREAIRQAREGRTVGMVCSGDAGLYGMAGLILELVELEKLQEEVAVEVIPGITSAVSCSALLGAPIVEDFCTISLSDYMIDWEKIRHRIRMAAEGDFTIAFYNPRSQARPDYLKEALQLIEQYRGGDTPVGVVRNAYREGQQVRTTTLEMLDDTSVDMFCTVIIGNSKSRLCGGKIVTARGYAL